MSKIITEEELINGIENEKDICLEDGFYGYSFHKISALEANPVVRTMEDDDPGKYMVVCSIAICYGPTQKLEKSFNHVELESLAEYIYYPMEDGSYDGGPFVVEKYKLYEFFRNSQK